MTTYNIYRANDGARPYPSLHDGSGTVIVRHFEFAGAAEPAILLTYHIPPGASEGAHRHAHDEPVEGAFDEFYYIITGQGVMIIDSEELIVRAGDQVHVPLGATRAIHNRSDSGLDVYVVALRR